MLAASATCAAIPALAQPVSTDPAAFTRALEGLAVRVAATSVPEIPDLIASIPPAWTVSAGDDRVQVSSAWITTALDAARKSPATWPQQRDALVAQLNAARHEATTLAAQPSGREMERSRRVAAEVLSRDEFQRNASDTAMAKLRQRIIDWFVALWDRLGGNRIGRRSATTVFAWVAGLSALAGLTWWLVFRVLAPSRRSGLALTPPAARRRSARAWARAAAAAHDPREAVRCAYHAAVVGLEEEGAWRADATRTPREHVRLLSAEHRRRTPFADVARRFEQVWFGGRAATTDDTRTVLTRLQELGCLPAE